MSDLIKEAERIVEKEKLTKKDLDRFEEIGNLLTQKEDKSLYGWLSEAMFQRSVELTDK